jgi:thiamine biosynthesis protein ThiI
MPVFRPLIGMDKNEVIEIARKIDTFETSILPYEDCCTVFVAKHPKTRPKLDEVEKELPENVYLAYDGLQVMV